MKTLHEKSKNIVRWNEERDQTEDGNNKFLAGTGWLRNSMRWFIFTSQDIYCAERSR